MIAKTFFRLLSACLLMQAADADVEVQAHYNLKGAGGIRDTACPESLPCRAGKGPSLARQGSPKVMSNGPECRRSEYDSSIKFEQPDQCYSVARNLVNGDNFAIEAWAYALKANDGGWHAVVASGTGGSGFILGQNGDQWAVLVGGVGGTNLGKVVPEKWTHLAIVKSRGAVSAWLDGARVKAALPGLGGGHPNFSIGATAPNKEAFAGWIAEVRHATFKPGAFDPAADFLMDTRRLREIRAGEVAARAKLVNALAATPGATAVREFDERPWQQDWLVTPPALPASVQVLVAPDQMSARIMLANGLVSRTFLVTDNLGCVGMKRSDKDIEFVRSVKPEVRFRVNDGPWLNIGGLTGMMDRAFITPEWFAGMESISGAFRFAGMTVGPCVKPYEWQPKCNAPADIPWPAKGKRVVFRFAPPDGATAPLDRLAVEVIYEIYEGLPVIMKTFSVKNGGASEVTISQFEGEHLAVQPSNSRMLHVESDYSCALINFTEKSSGLGIHAGGGRAAFKDYYLGGGTTRFIRDPEWGSMATLNPQEDIFLDDPENALLLSRPSVGPDWTVKPGEFFDAFRTFEILNDTTERERFHLAQRRFYRKLAPQTNEKMFEVHAPVTRDMKTLGPLMDQMEEIGFNQLQAPEHPGGFNYADSSPGNIASMKAICDYGKKKGIRVGAYQLMMASAGWGSRQDNYNCIDPATKQPGSAFGQSACGASAWADMYYDNMWKTIEGAGMGAFKPDGPYHGDPCAATDHPHHKGLADSQWAQWKWMCKVLAEGQRRNLYLTIPDWYVLNGQACTGMGYREATDNIDIVLQTVIYRQYIYDATFHKTAQMGWVNLNTEMLRGGMEANLDKYERIFFTMLSSGAQVWVRGHRLYDGPDSRAMLLKWMAWYRKYEKIILGDIIHLKRPDGRGLDYYLHVNPAGPHKGMLLVFNPLDREIKQTLDIPLHYAGLTGSAKVREGEGAATTLPLGPDASLRLPVTLPANGYSWFVLE
ncbi:MAG: LamG domain-containing protein [Verrucomicrobia bacterium]|nr:LamG domain-containing protein [Verrucomicrobiota bacterium]